MYLQLNVQNVILGLVLMLLAAGGSGDMMQQPIVGIEMDKAGMHRTLSYNVQYDYPLAGKECEYMLEQPLPAAVYVSTDELDSLQRLKKLNAVYPKFVDIELPTEKSQEFTVLLRGAPKITDTLTLPIHFRYHAPSDKSTHATVVIGTPLLYLNCPISDNELIDNELVARPDKLYCLNKPASRFDELDDKVKTSSERCNWKQIHVDYQLKSPLSIEIPVGNTKAYPPILYATIIISWTLSIWTVMRTQSVPRRINHRLNEQRLLQQKVK